MSDVYDRIVSDGELLRLAQELAAAKFRYHQIGMMNSPVLPEEVVKMSALYIVAESGLNAAQQRYDTRLVALKAEAER